MDDQRGFRTTPSSPRMRSSIRFRGSRQSLRCVLGSTRSRARTRPSSRSVAGPLKEDNALVSARRIQTRRASPSDSRQYPYYEQLVDLIDARLAIVDTDEMRLPLYLSPRVPFNFTYMNEGGLGVANAKYRFRSARGRGPRAGGVEPRLGRVRSLWCNSRPARNSTWGRASNPDVGGAAPTGDGRSSRLQQPRPGLATPSATAARLRLVRTVESDLKGMRRARGPGHHHVEMCSMERLTTSSTRPTRLRDRRSQEQSPGARVGRRLIGAWTRGPAVLVPGRSRSPPSVQSDGPRRYLAAVQDRRRQSNLDTRLTQFEPLRLSQSEAQQHHADTSLETNRRFRRSQARDRFPQLVAG